MRACKSCGVSKPLDSFKAAPRCKEGRTPTCTACINEARAEKRRANPEAHRARSKAWRDGNTQKARDSVRSSTLKMKYGISRSDYERMRDEQGGVCAICSGPETSRDPRWSKLRELAVDHCHLTGRVRGLLCFACNSGIGKFSDSPDTLRAAAIYLEAAP